ncbi:acyl-CoA-binding protein [Mucilaginibacter sp. FT3.2]|uniref:acyl-CoA-binding protein n=1 Tax=Mucilaginibacter sp. FT3.2 TaxID=2723090 RepID=UPI001609E93D|nr:acyl-CoA-binding protein [Mucilaginibacter sp. FT3.2]MBB6229784.1 acyl-CoA-binding protein [Mucilaginibacter sp. FT3.2]
MTDLKDAFEEAVKESKQLPSKPDNETLLRLYSLYKQATEGDINTENPPGMFDFVAKAKYDAWLKQKGTTADNAMQQYIGLVAQLSNKTD